MRLLSNIAWDQQMRHLELRLPRGERERCGDLLRELPRLCLALKS